MKHQRPDDDFLRVKKSEIFGSLFQYYTIQKKNQFKKQKYSLNISIKIPENLFKCCKIKDIDIFCIYLDF